jgi:hypothetical protein
MPAAHAWEKAAQAIQVLQLCHELLWHHPGARRGGLYRPALERQVLLKEFS